MTIAVDMGRKATKTNKQLYSSKVLQNAPLAPREHSAILLTFIKLPFVIKIFVLSILGGCFMQVLLYKQLLQFSYIVQKTMIFALVMNFKMPKIVGITDCEHDKSLFITIGARSPRCPKLQ